MAIGMVVWPLRAFDNEAQGVVGRVEELYVGQKAVKGSNGDWGGLLAGCPRYHIGTCVNSVEAQAAVEEEPQAHEFMGEVAKGGSEVHVPRDACEAGARSGHGLYPGKHGRARGLFCLVQVIKGMDLAEQFLLLLIVVDDTSDTCSCG